MSNITPSFQKLSNKKVCFVCHYPLGDKICALSATREYARKHPEQDVYFEGLDSVVEAFGDGLVKAGRPEGSEVIHFTIDERFCVKDKSPYFNLAGCFLSLIGIIPTSPPKPELPEVPCFASLKPQEYIAVQPWAYTSKNPPENIMQSIVARCNQHFNLPIIVVGKMDKTRSFLVDVKYDYLSDDIILMLSIIKYAKCVITAWSAASHIAAAYDIPMILPPTETTQLPGTENFWLSDYPLAFTSINKFFDYMNQRIT